MTDSVPTSDVAAAHPHVLVQAPVAPVDADGVAAALIGTGAFAALALACWWWRAELAAQGNQWWLWTCLVGAAIGLVMVWFTRRRRSRSGRTGDDSVEERSVD